VQLGALGRSSREGRLPRRARSGEGLKEREGGKKGEERNLTTQTSALDLVSSLCLQLDLLCCYSESPDALLMKRRRVIFSGLVKREGEGGREERGGGTPYAGLGVEN